MKYSNANDVTDQPVTLDNEATPYATVFFSASPVATSASAVSDIAPDAHLLSLGIKLDTEIFLSEHE